jgi:hypothetical protein
MWEPYATLRSLRKPVDFIIIPYGEHVITNPGEQMISQGAAVDWFRFWLRGEEDPDPAKVDQHKRWHELRKLQDDSDRASINYEWSDLGCSGVRACLVCGFKHHEMTPWLGLQFKGLHYGQAGVIKRA